MPTAISNSIYYHLYLPHIQTQTTRQHRAAESNLSGGYANMKMYIRTHEHTHKNRCYCVSAPVWKIVLHLFTIRTHHIFNVRNRNSVSRLCKQKAVVRTKQLCCREPVVSKCNIIAKTKSCRYKKLYSMHFFEGGNCWAASFVGANSVVRAQHRVNLCAYNIFVSIIVRRYIQSGGDSLSVCRAKSTFRLVIPLCANCTEHGYFVRLGEAEIPYSAGPDATE